MASTNEKFKTINILNKGMKLKEEYSKFSDKEEDKLNKTILSNDAYAICDFIEQLIGQIKNAQIRGTK